MGNASKKTFFLLKISSLETLGGAYFCPFLLIFSSYLFNMIIWPDCPLLPPTPGHLCVPPTTANDCHYNTDHCCCGNCPQRFTFSCAVDSTTGAGLWEKLHSSICPAHGCGKEGAYYVAKPRSRPEVRISIIDKGRRKKNWYFLGIFPQKGGRGVRDS